MTFKISTLFLLIVLILSNAAAQKLPKKKEVMEKMVLANEYFMKKWPDPGIPIVTDKTRASHIWTRAVYYEGLMALYKLNPDKAYYTKCNYIAVQNVSEKI